MGKSVSHQGDVLGRVEFEADIAALGYVVSANRSIVRRLPDDRAPIVDEDVVGNDNVSRVTEVNSAERGAAPCHIVSRDVDILADPQIDCVNACTSRGLVVRYGYIGRV